MPQVERSGTGKAGYPARSALALINALPGRLLPPKSAVHRTADRTLDATENGRRASPGPNAACYCAGVG